MIYGIKLQILVPYLGALGKFRHCTCTPRIKYKYGSHFTGRRVFIILYFTYIYTKPNVALLALDKIVLKLAVKRVCTYIKRTQKKKNHAAKKKNEIKTRKM